MIAIKDHWDWLASSLTNLEFPKGNGDSRN